MDRTRHCPLRSEGTELSLKNRNWLRPSAKERLQVRSTRCTWMGGLLYRWPKGKTNKAAVSVIFTHLRKEHKLAIVKKVASTGMRETSKID